MTGTHMSGNLWRGPKMDCSKVKMRMRMGALCRVGKEGLWLGWLRWVGGRG